MEYYMPFKKGNSDIGYNMYEHWGHCAKWNKLWFYLHEVFRCVVYDLIIKVKVEDYYENAPHLLTFICKQDLLSATNRVVNTYSHMAKTTSKID